MLFACLCVWGHSVLLCCWCCCCCALSWNCWLQETLWAGMCHTMVSFTKPMLAPKRRGREIGGKERAVESENETPTWSTGTMSVDCRNSKSHKNCSHSRTTTASVCFWKKRKIKHWLSVTPIRSKLGSNEQAKHFSVTLCKRMLRNANVVFNFSKHTHFDSVFIRNVLLFCVAMHSVAIRNFNGSFRVFRQSKVIKVCCLLFWCALAWPSSRNNLIFSASK